MKPGIKTAAIVASMIAGTALAERPAQQEGPPQRQLNRQGQPGIQYPNYGWRPDGQRRQGAFNPQQPGMQGPRQGNPQMQGRRQFQGQGNQQFQGPQGQGCPQLTPQQRQQATQRRRQFQGQGNQQFQGPQGQDRPQLSLQQREKIQQKRQQIVQKFDKDGDGVLSEKERAHAKKSLKKQMKKNRQAPEGTRPQPPAE